MLKIKQTLIISTLFFTTLFANAQEIASVEKSVFGAQIGVLGAWVNYEARLTNKIALRSEIGVDTGLYGRSNSTGYILGAVITLEPRWYYNLSKRKNKSKRIDKNSGNFISIKSSYHPDLIIASSDSNVNLISDLTIVPTWGIRRHIGNHFNYEAGIGIGYIHYFNDKDYIIIDEADVAVNLHLRLGYTF